MISRSRIIGPIAARLPMISPVASACTCDRVGLTVTPSRLGLLRSGTVASEQPLAATVPRSTAAKREVRISEPHVDGEEEAAARRVRRDVDVPRDRLVAEVADLGVEPAIVGEGEQVAAAELEPDVARAAGEHAVAER